ncbi:MAG: response regulator [Firmicutes bacterium]|nr:response regulator [Bacillota bacterium]
MNEYDEVIILVADDDPDDQFMIEESFKEARITTPLHFVNDGEELVAYLKRQGKYSTLADLPLPGLILLDLNMPRMDGREVLKELKADPDWRRIPVIVFTTSQTEGDITRMYDLGVNSFITKPATFEGLVKIIDTLIQYWLEVVELPV